MMNLSDLEYLVEHYPDKQWHWGSWGLSSNPSISTRFIERHPNKQWEWGFGGISLNKSVEMEFINNNLDKPWEWGIGGLSSNTGITVEFIENHLDKPWNWGEYGLSYNSAITVEFINRHLDKPWDWGSTGLSANPSITVDFIEQHIDKPWYWMGHNRDGSGLSCNPAITVEFVSRHNAKPWDYLELDYILNPVALLEYMIKNIHNRTLPCWDIIDLSNISETDIEIIGNSSSIYGCLVCNSTIPLDFIERYKQYFNFRHWRELSRNPAVTTEYIEKNNDKPWCWGMSGISSNKSVTADFIIKNIDKPWDWGKSGLSCNKLNINSIQEEKQRTINRTMEIKKELIMKSWHPNRVQDWCFDNEDKS